MTPGQSICSALAISVVLGSSICNAEEIVVRRGTLPGALMIQEIAYSSTEADYNGVRDEILARMKLGDLSAFQNPEGVPTKRVKTTATIGIIYKGVGAGEGKVHLRLITAAEEALYKYEKWMDEKD